MARKNPLQSMTREEADETIRRLPDMNTARLTDLWAALFGTVCYTRRRAFIIRRLEWRINTLMSGGISERALKRAEKIHHHLIHYLRGIAAPNSNFINYKL